MAYWIVVGSEENMRIAEARGFDIFGFKSTRRAEVSQMQPGDKLIFYLTKIMKFGGLAEVTSAYFEDHTQVFRSSKPGEDYPFRVKGEAHRGPLAGAVLGREGNRPGPGVHQEVARRTLAPRLPGQPPRDPGVRLQAHRGTHAAGSGIVG